MTFWHGIVIGAAGVIVLEILVFLVAFHRSQEEQDFREAKRRRRAEVADTLGKIDSRNDARLNEIYQQVRRERESRQ